MKITLEQINGNESKCLQKLNRDTDQIASGRYWLIEMTISLKKFKDFIMFKNNLILNLW